MGDGDPGVDLREEVVYDGNRGGRKKEEEEDLLLEVDDVKVKGEEESEVKLGRKPKFRVGLWGVREVEREGSGLMWEVPPLVTILHFSAQMRRRRRRLCTEGKLNR